MVAAADRFQVALAPATAHKAARRIGGAMDTDVPRWIDQYQPCVGIVDHKRANDG
jgi:hypothetical protein